MSPAPSTVPRTAPTPVRVVAQLAAKLQATGPTGSDNFSRRGGGAPGPEGASVRNRSTIRAAAPAKATRTIRPARGDPRVLWVRRRGRVAGDVRSSPATTRVPSRSDEAAALNERTKLRTENPSMLFASG